MTLYKFVFLEMMHVLHVVVDIHVYMHSWGTTVVLQLVLLNLRFEECGSGKSMLLFKKCNSLTLFIFIFFF